MTDETRHTAAEVAAAYHQRSTFGHLVGDLRRCIYRLQMGSDRVGHDVFNRWVAELGDAARQVADGCVRYLEREAARD